MKVPLHYDRLEALLLSKSYEELSSVEQHWVLQQGLDAHSYKQQQQIIQQAQTWGKQSAPAGSLAALQATFKQQHATKLPWFKRGIPLYQVLLGIFLWWAGLEYYHSNQTTVPSTPTPKVVAPIVQVDTIYKEKIVYKDSIIYQERIRTIQLPAPAPDTIYVRLDMAQRDLFYKDSLNYSRPATEIGARSLQDMGDLKQFIGASY